MLVAQRILTGMTHKSVDFRGNVAFTDQKPGGLNILKTLFTDLAIGNPNSGRLVIVGIYVNDGTTGGDFILNSVTIGGTSATRAVSTVNPTLPNRVKSEIWAAIVPTGTTATIVANYSLSGSPDNDLDALAAAVWTSDGFSTATAYSTSGSTEDPAVSSSFTIQPGSILIGFGASGAGSPTSCTWTNAEQSFFASFSTVGYSGAVISRGYSGTVTCDYSSTSAGGRVTSFAAWAP